MEGESIIKSNSPFISLMIAFGSVFFLFFIILKLFRKTVSKKGKKEKIWDIMLDEDWYPSLPRFQIFVWTVIMVFAFCLDNIVQTIQYEYVICSNTL